MARNDETSRSPRGQGGGRVRLFGLLGLLALLLIGFVIYWALFRDNSAASVDSVEAAEARQAAIDEAAAEGASSTDGDDGDSTYAGDETGDDASDANDDGSTGEANTSGQADAAATGVGLDGVWTVDTSIGTFGPECLEVVCGAGFVGFRINEELAGVGAKTVVGRTPAITGTLQVDGSRITAVDITADMTELITDDTGRTAAIKGVTGGLETQRFPEATFSLAEPIELGSLPVEGAAVEVIAVGDLTVHGVTQRKSIPLVAEHQAGLIVVSGSLVDIPLSDFDIPKPTSIVVLSVEEIATMELQLFFSR